MGFLEKLFGSYSEREVKKLQKLADKIEALDQTMQSLSDYELKAKTDEFKKRLKNGETLDDILPEAFAVCREAAWRVLGMKHYRVQLIGGMVLHQGRIAEMKTGEGKTLVATLPLYLNALTGEGVHLVTVNDYLATRDVEWMGKLYNFLGLSTGCIVHGLTSEQRREAYSADITYGTNNEFGFDYLRDNMVIYKEEKVQRKLNFAVVDEVDSILIDEARTPLIISGAGEKSTKFYNVADNFVKQLLAEADYTIDEKANSVMLTDAGVEKAERAFGIDNYADADHLELQHYITQALKANYGMKIDKDYMVKDGQVIIVDEFTGRLMEGRRYSDGLHQAIEAKEGVKIASENQTLATITLQNYFRMYKKLSGMTGTAETEATEFMHTYGLEVVVIPTNLPVIRKDNADLVYKTKKEKINAIIDRIQGLYEKGQPVLVGTISIKSSEELSELLKKRGVPHNVLNAKFHAQEAEIVAQAGRYKAVTIATNMAGRGTDIMLGGNPEFMALDEVGSRDDERFPEVLAKYQEQCKEEKEKVLALGGLFILGTERHESRRIDNQLRGRSGRQGDPGESEFYLSLEDDLMRLFGSERVMVWMDRLKLPEGEPITHGMINSAIEKAQKKIEARNFGIRKNLLEFDDVMNKQRTAIYESRNEALAIDNLKDRIMGMLHRNITEKVYEKFAPEMREDWDIDGLNEYLKDFYVYEEADDKAYLRSTKEEYAERIYNALVEQYNNKEAELGSDLMRKLEKHILFDVVDNRWRGHLKSLDALRESIYLRAYGQRDPVTEYKLISSQIFEEMIATIQEQATSFLFKVVVNTEPVKDEEDEIEEAEIKEVNTENTDGLCPCGSGKPYEKCCGR